MIKLRPSISRDFVHLTGELPKKMTKAYTVEKDGEALGIGGLTFVDGKCVVFCNIPGESPPAKSIIKCAYLVEKLMNNYGSTVWASQDEEILTSKRFLEHFGFEQIEGDLWARSV